MFRLQLKRLFLVLPLISGLAIASAATAQEAEFEQVKLTDAQVSNFLKANSELQNLLEKIEKAGENPDPALVSQLEELARKYGFQSFDDLDTVVSNISFVISGFDQESGQFSEPKEAMAEEIKALKSDTSIPEKERNALIQELEEAVKNTPKVAHQENVALVKKYFKELDNALN